MEKVNIEYINRKFLDIEYDNKSEAQKLDIYLPEKGEGPFPVIVSIHGGAFMMGDKQDHQLIPMLEGLNKGYAVVSINYRLSGEAKWPAQIIDVKKAIIYIKENAAKYLLNPYKVAVWGGSAGGHLSAMVGTTIGQGKFEDINSQYDSNVNAVVDWFGPTDFLKMDEQLKTSNIEPQDHNEVDSPESKLLGAKITEIPELVKDANPITYISKNLPPFFIQHGRIDDKVPYQQSEILYNELLKYADKDTVSFEIIEGAKHGGPHFRTNENIEKVFVFLDKYMK
ncbi:MAG: alpha/beta hydrolase fold domain-containing protein [Peptostreptococcaceae bacterium]